MPRSVHAGFTWRAYSRIVRPVAIIENDAAARAELRNAIEDAGFRAHCFGDAASAVAKVKDRGFAAAIFSLDLRNDDPFAMCGALSRVVPLIAITDAREGDRCAQALEAGADDCAVRPLPPRELIARLRNVMRRVEMDVDGEEGLSISIAEMRVRTGRTVHNLTRGEAELLAVLADRAPSPLSPAQLAEILGAKKGTVQSRIKSLRKKLGVTRLANRARLGYHLVLE